jgi:hypothetical protein
VTYSYSGLRKFDGVSLRTGKIIDKGKIWVISDLSERGEQRLQWLEFYWAHNQNARLTCRHFGISARTFYKAKNRYACDSYRGLNDLSKRPRIFRKSKIPLQTITAVVKLREKYPTWSKYKIGAYLRQRGTILSDSSIGRILKSKNKINSHVSRKKKRIYKRSKKRVRINGEIFILKHPGDLIQIDVKHLYYPWGDKAYQFTAIDCVTKLRLLRLYTVKTAATGRTFLREVVRFMPFRIKRVQSDNGSEFLGNFRKECLQQKIRHYFSYPNSPEQNAFVESSHSTDEREFYSQVELPADTEKLRILLQNWQDCYNHERPHQSLNQRTPWDYYKATCQII